MEVFGLNLRKHTVSAHQASGIRHQASGQTECMRHEQFAVTEAELRECAAVVVFHLLPFSPHTSVQIAKNGGATFIVSFFCRPDVLDGGSPTE